MPGRVLAIVQARGYIAYDPQEDTETHATGGLGHAHPVVTSPTIRKRILKP